MSAKSNKKSDYEVDHNVFILIFAAPPLICNFSCPATSLAIFLILINWDFSKHFEEFTESA
jgi:hypothetical protein